ncbi:MAG: [Fe-Fe] hydrogenase large subunit C-terminal domain-containing protein [Erysipelotrichaceae bacterium]
MKGIITLKESDCRNCFKCVRMCPTKSISFSNGKPQIDEKQCIACGRCYLICPQSAKQVISDMDKVKNWLKNKEEVVISVAPAYQSVWVSFSKLKQGLMELGFSHVEETAVGAAVVSSQYLSLIEEGTMRNIIETCCPAIVKLIETRFPELIPQCSPVASPMVVHCRMLKAKYPNAKIVFLSPCIAKQQEALDPRFSDAVDAVLAMNDMDEWLLDIDGFDEIEEKDENIARLYPVSGGIIKTFPPQSAYKTLVIEGLDRCTGALKSIMNGHLKGYFFEMNACPGGCLGGPYLCAYQENEWLAQSRIARNEAAPKIKSEKHESYVNAVYENHFIDEGSFTENQILEVLSRTGKQDKSKRLDCGACGYETCRAKAIAVLQGKSDAELCLPYALEHAQSISNLIIKHTPNGIIVLDSHYKILEINPSALTMMQLQNYSVKGFDVQAVLPGNQIMDILNHVESVSYFVEEYPQVNKVFEHAVISINEKDAFVIILMDLTEKSKQKEHLRQLRQDTIDSTQEVINKQMRVVQEIASLLGETTAETKVVLTRLNKAMQEDDK